MARAASMVGDRWTLLVLRALLYGQTRFDMIQALTGAPRDVLSRRLKRMADDGLIERRGYRDAGARGRFEYLLTGKGRGLLHALVALMEWGDAHLRDDAPPLTLRSARTGARLRLALVDEDGRAVDPADLLFAPAGS